MNDHHANEYSSIRISYLTSVSLHQPVVLPVPEAHVLLVTQNAPPLPHSVLPLPAVLKALELQSPKTMAPALLVLSLVVVTVGPFELSISFVLAFLKSTPIGVATGIADDAFALKFSLLKIALVVAALL